jgi:hypothetical protein
MTQGFLLFAHNNEQIPYGLFAVWQARRISKWLGKPASLVADQHTVDKLGTLVNVFDKVIISNTLSSQKKSYGGEQLSFNNVDRCMAWELTPYEETMVVDTDIVIQSNKLNTVWNNAEDILVCRNSNDVFGRKFVGFDYISNHGVKFYWATEFYFKKNDASKVFFDTCNRIKQNYNWYAHVYDITTKYIRNDHVWSMALHELGGKSNSSWATELPFNLYFAIDSDNIIKMEDDLVILHSSNKIRKVKGCDVHTMNKISLLEHIKEELAYE